MAVLTRIMGWTDGQWRGGVLVVISLEEVSAEAGKSGQAISIFRLTSRK